MVVPVEDLHHRVGEMSEAFTRRGPFASSTSVRCSGECIRRRTSLRLRTTSVTSSTTPVIVENSCCTPSMRTEVMAPPCREDRRILRRAFPRVVPKPRSRGSATEFSVIERRRVGLDLDAARRSIAVSSFAETCVPLLLGPNMLTSSRDRRSTVPGSAPGCPPGTAES